MWPHLGFPAMSNPKLKRLDVNILFCLCVIVTFTLVPVPSHLLSSWYDFPCWWNSDFFFFNHLIPVLALYDLNFVSNEAMLIRAVSL